MKKIYVSTPVEGKKRSEIYAAQEVLLEQAKAKIFQRFKVGTKWMEPYIDGTGALLVGECLALSLVKLALADFVVWDAGWNNSPWCRIEHLFAETYGIPTLTL
ncbi:MAG: hypothetical protein IJR68_06540 [Fretibacterium sp.]|nr:hypothetical protein [Fretibacterium sp.]